jgi:CheY-like chemotaxis protein
LAKSLKLNFFTDVSIEKRCMKRILIVEDNRLERRILVHILQSAYCNKIWLDEAIDGESAIKFISGKENYDLIITDLLMPRIEGLELISRIKLHNPHYNKILAISGGNPYYLTLAKKMGAVAVFTKPLDKEKFLDSVNSIINSAPIKKAM